MQNMDGGDSHKPQTPDTTNSPRPGPDIPRYQQQQIYQNPDQFDLLVLVRNQDSYLQDDNLSAAITPQATTAASSTESSAPAPTVGHESSWFRHTRAGSTMSQPSGSSPDGPAVLMQPISVMPEGEPLTHVVGSQLGRGNLPSAPGRLATPTAGRGTKNTVVAMKDADGRLHCPECTKTFRYAKHFNRHFRIHTGERPYICGCCCKTFIRSDALSRHQRQSNGHCSSPAQGSHLSHPQARVKMDRQPQEAAVSVTHDGDLDQANDPNYDREESMLELPKEPSNLNSEPNYDLVLSQSSGVTTYPSPPDFSHISFGGYTKSMNNVTHTKAYTGTVVHYTGHEAGGFIRP